MAKPKRQYKPKPDAAPKVPYHEQIATKLIEQLEAGTAPWQRPWTPGSLSLPHNPVSGTKYKGSNVVWLQMHGHADPRWMTYKQAASIGAQVRKGEHGTIIQYWKVSDRVVVTDAAGNPVIKDGEKVYRNVQLDRPRAFTSVVFNASQIDGLPPLTLSVPAWDRHERAEALLKATGADIRHDQADEAFYRPATDRIHMPTKEQFPDADGYYSTALHEVGHYAESTIMPSSPTNPTSGAARSVEGVGINRQSLRRRVSGGRVRTERPMAANTSPRVESATQSHWIDAHRAVFLQQLDAQGYNRGTVAIYARVAARFCAEVRRRDPGGPVLCAEAVESVQTAVLADISEHSRSDAIYPLKRFLGYLAAAGVAVLPATAETPTALERLGQEYERYLRHQRGLSDATIYHCMRFYVRFMTFRFGEDLGDLEAITPDDIVDYLLTFRRGPTASRDKTPPSHLRSLFKFLFWSGKTERDLAASIPRVARPKSPPRPRYLSPEDVGRLIDAMRSDDAVGRRNYAMMILMARLGLRAPELVAIQLEDIDWRAGEILIRGKGRLHDRMPLPVDAGEALVDYIRNGRAGTSRSLFVCSKAPYPPFVNAQIVNALLRRAFKLTGLRPPQAYVGSHVLRHSLATDLLHKGASLEEVGDVLRHRSRMATTIYAQYDVEALRSIARPWPELVAPAPVAHGGV